jgi:hypothetical protein
MKALKKKTEVYLRPYNHKELIGLYEVSPHVLNTWLMPIKPQIGKVLGRCYTIRQVKLIFDTLGAPGQSMEVPVMNTSIKVHPEAVYKYIEISWDYTYRSFLFRHFLNEDEIETIKGLLTNYYQSISPEFFTIESKLHYETYCKRINKLKKCHNQNKAKVLSAIEFALSDTIKLDCKLPEERSVRILNLSDKMEA